MAWLLSSTACGLLFGFGLALSQMTDRQRVLGFLDVAGNWDPTLIFVMGGAVVTTLLSFRFILKREAPLLDEKFHLPQLTRVDLKLVLGAALFGIGWGIAGYCPGPAIAALNSLTANPLLFFISFIIGSRLADYLQNLKN